MHDPVGPAFPATARSSELEAALLDVVNESELEAFVSGLVDDAARSAGRRIPAHTGRPRRSWSRPPPASTAWSRRG